MRRSLDRGRPQLTPLAAELEFLDGYLALQSLSCGDRLVLERDVPVDTLAARVPAMILQPLVENSIVHALSTRPGRCTIRVRCRREGDRLRIEVADSGPGFPKALDHRRGVGLSATESRLQLLFGAAQSVRYGVSDLGGASTRLSFPYRESRERAEPAGIAEAAL